MKMGSLHENEDDALLYEEQIIKQIEYILDDSSNSVSNSPDTSVSPINSNLKDKKIDKNYANENKYKFIKKRIDTSKVKHKTVRSNLVHSALLKNIAINTEEPIRSGAIIYTKMKGKTYFCLGIDTASGDLTDFAGGVKKDESVIEGGLRELAEESQGVFGDIDINSIGNSLCVYNKNILIMFIYKDVNIYDITNKFIERTKTFNNRKYSETLEVSHLCWLEREEFLDSINGKGRKMYTRIRRILSNVISEIERL